MRKLKERILSFVLTFVMVLSLFAGMAPVEVQAEEGSGRTVIDKMDISVNPDFLAALRNNECYSREYPFPFILNGGEAYRFASDSYEFLDADKNEVTNGTTVDLENNTYYIASAIVIIDDKENYCFADELSALSGDDNFDFAFIAVESEEFSTYNYVVRVSYELKPGTSGGETPTPDETDGKIKNLASIVTYNESTKKITATLDQAKTYAVAFVSYEMVSHLTPDQFNGTFAAKENLMEWYKKCSVLPKEQLTDATISGVINKNEGFNDKIIVEATSDMILKNETTITIPVENGGIFEIYEIIEDDKRTINDYNYGERTFYIVYGAHGVYIPAEETSGGNPPAADKATVKFVKSNFTGSLEYSDGTTELQQVPEGLEIEMQKGKTLTIASDTDFTLTISGSTISSWYIDGLNKFLCEIEDVQTDLTITVAPTGQGGGGDGGGETPEPTTPPYLTPDQNIKKIENSIGEVVNSYGRNVFKFTIPEVDDDNYCYIAGVLSGNRITQEILNYETVTVGQPVLDVKGTCSGMTDTEFDPYYTQNYYSLANMSEPPMGGVVESTNGDEIEVTDGDVVYLFKVHKDNFVRIVNQVTLPGQSTPIEMPWLHYAIYELKYEIVNISDGCSHDWETKYDENNHYRQCVDCSEVKDTAAHTFANNVCSICGYEKVVTPPADDTCSHDWETKYDENNHYRQCVDCSEVKDSAAHTYTNNVCSICGYEKVVTPPVEEEPPVEEPPVHTHDWSGEWTIIKEATATEEGKKETFCVSGCGQKKVVIIPKTGEVDENENFEKDAEVTPEAPIDEATLNNTKEELLESNIFSDEEKELIEAGTSARVWLEIGKVDEATIPADDKTEMENAAVDVAGENAVITYFDATLFKQVGDLEAKKVKESDTALKITIVIPDELLNTDAAMQREYTILRLHEGVVTPITGTFDAATGEFSFETDCFSTYGIVYADSPVEEEEKPDTPQKPDDTQKPDNTQKDEVPKTGEVNGTSYAFVLMLLSVFGYCFCARKREEMK